ncbi:hypothetical protein PoB_006511300 [Plakobranchus ocellatus]|uniref:Uncharacterized protein n=1 Tax=Plakobranchus ocellatus TaxID=259542 RepID=A0AAV4D361_9GAST|nr:hypothetical protein PoB_006511300 [Plakobranchus ocellatus]
MVDVTVAHLILSHTVSLSKYFTYIQVNHLTEGRLKQSSWTSHPTDLARLKSGVYQMDDPKPVDLVVVRGLCGPMASESDYRSAGPQAHQ